MGVGIKSHIFGICQKVFFRHKNENGFLSNLGGRGVRASLTFVNLFFWKASIIQETRNIPVAKTQNPDGSVIVNSMFHN